MILPISVLRPFQCLPTAPPIAEPSMLPTPAPTGPPKTKPAPAPIRPPIPFPILVALSFFCVSPLNKSKAEKATPASAASFPPIPFPSPANFSPPILVNKLSKNFVPALFPLFSKIPATFEPNLVAPSLEPMLLNGLANLLAALDPNVLNFPKIPPSSTVGFNFIFLGIFLNNPDNPPKSFKDLPVPII